MNRLFFVAILSSLVAGGAIAGPIAINLSTAGNAGASVLNHNLASNGFIPCTSGTTTNSETCTTSNGTVAPIPSGSPTSFSTVLFNSAQVPFDIASGGANSDTGVGDTSNIWSPNNTAGSKSITIDVGTYTTNSQGASTSGTESGLFGVDQIWTMLNDVYGTVGYQGITLTLSGYGADGVTPITETVDLTAGVDYRSIGGATLSGDPTACDVANIGVATLGSSCVGHTSTTTPSVGTDSSYNATNVSEGVSITVYNDAFETTDTMTPIANNYWLDVQDIDLGSSFLDGWLNTVTVTSNDGTGQQDKAILTALTVDTVATPEPATLGMLLSGLAGFAAFKFRKRNG